MSSKVIRVAMWVLLAQGCLTSCGTTGGGGNQGGGESANTSNSGSITTVQAPAPKGTESWTLYQTNDVTGEQVTYVTPNGVRVCMKDSGLNYLCKAPDWNFVIYNTGSKKYSEVPFSKLQHQQKKLADAVKSDKDEFQRGKDGKVADLNATQFLSKEKFADGTETVVESWFTTDLTGPASAAHILSKGTTASRAGLPPGAVLIRMISTNEGTKLVALDTVKSERGPVPDSIFELPGGYKKVENAMLD